MLTSEELLAIRFRSIEDAKSEGFDRIFQLPIYSDGFFTTIDGCEVYELAQFCQPLRNYDVYPKDVVVHNLPQRYPGDEIRKIAVWFSYVKRA